MQQQEQLVRTICAAYTLTPANLSASALKRHKKKFKKDLIILYQRRSNTTTSTSQEHVYTLQTPPPLNVSYIKCMITNLSIRSNKVIATHLVNSYNEKSLLVLGYKPSYMWDPHNGLLLYESIYKAYNSQYITFLIDPKTSTIRIRVLYDDILERPVISSSDYELIEGYTDISPQAQQAIANMTFKDIDGYYLQLPTLVFPSRRILFWAAHSAYNNAMCSSRSHACAEASCPTEEEWDQLTKYTQDCPSRAGNNVWLSSVNGASDVFSSGHNSDDYDDDNVDVSV